MIKFFKSPLGNVVAAVLFIGGIGALVFLRTMDKGEVDFAPPAQEAYDYKPDVYKRDIPRFKMPGSVVAANETNAVEAETPTAVPEEEAPLSRPQQARLKEEKTKAKGGLPLNLFTGAAPDQGTELSPDYAPFGRLIPCELIITVESSSMDTPIIGLVTEDVVHAGKVIIPAGAEVHGRASEGNTRDRIAATGTWNFVWRTHEALNGTELTLQGIALDREFDFNTGLWGLQDGSAGLKGYLIKSDDWNEIKLFAATFLAAATQGFKQYDDFITDMGSAVQIAESSVGNAALDGTTAVLEKYAEQIQAAIERDGFYIRVPAGTQFYVYVTQTIDATEGSRGNISNHDIWNQQTN
jgi:hypothetical protein